MAGRGVARLARQRMAETSAVAPVALMVARTALVEAAGADQVAQQAEFPAAEMKAVVALEEERETAGAAALEETA